MNLVANTKYENTDTKNENTVVETGVLKTVGIVRINLRAVTWLADIVGMMPCDDPKDRETTACDFAHFIADRLKSLHQYVLGVKQTYISRNQRIYYAVE